MYLGALEIDWSCKDWDISGLVKVVAVGLAKRNSGW